MQTPTLTSAEIARKIRLLRERSGMTQAQLAGAIGTRQPSIARVESRRSLPTLDMLARIADALGAKLVIELA